MNRTSTKMVLLALGASALVFGAGCAAETVAPEEMESTAALEKEYEDIFAEEQADEEALGVAEQEFRRCGFGAFGCGPIGALPVPAPYPVPVATPVPQPYAVPVDRPVPVPVPVVVERPVPVPVAFPQPYPVPVPQPYAVPVARPVPVPVACRFNPGPCGAFW
ncbi:hypothetical protein [Polyangium spumosum]|uniref:Uncharacterized protein n=1 Tax=Polyangium spumosum TaxID=889282 RepID=A0A6N7Q2G9_9BACT|nr:hypothetical protein [Polyangium spumosum]MRG97010.1 hypothetical protein [Polyangium spumosum]